MSDNPHGTRVLVMGEKARHQKIALRDEKPTEEEIQACTFVFKKWTGKDGYLPGRCSLPCRHGMVVRTEDFPDDMAQSIAILKNVNEGDTIVVPKMTHDVKEVPGEPE